MVLTFTEPSVLFSISPVLCLVSVAPPPVILASPPATSLYQHRSVNLNRIPSSLLIPSSQPPCRQPVFISRSSISLSFSTEIDEERRRIKKNREQSLRSSLRLLLRSSLAGRNFKLPLSASPVPASPVLTLHHRLFYLRLSLSQSPFVWIGHSCTIDRSPVARTWFTDLLRPTRSGLESERKKKRIMKLRFLLTIVLRFSLSQSLPSSRIKIRRRTLAAQQNSREEGEPA